MDILTLIAERKIAEAIKNGRLTTVEHWKNKPLPLEDDSFVADDLKIAYKILKNSGYLPPEIETRKEIKNLQDLIASTEDEHTRIKQMRKLNVLLRKLDTQRNNKSNIAAHDDYYKKVVERISVYAGNPASKSS